MGKLSRHLSLCLHLVLIKSNLLTVFTFLSLFLLTYLKKNLLDEFLESIYNFHIFHDGLSHLATTQNVINVCYIVYIILSAYSAGLLLCIFFLNMSLTINLAL